MSTIVAKSGLKLKNSGGAVMSAGSDNGSSPLSARLVSKANDVGVFGSTPISTNDVVVGYSDFNINASLNTVQQPLRPELAQSIHKTESDRTYFYTTAFRNGYYNIFTGSFFIRPSVSLTSFSSDKAANPTRNVPGSLSFINGSKVPVDQNYEKKTG